MRIFYTGSEGETFDFSTLDNAPSPRIVRIKTADFHHWEYLADGVAQKYGLNVAQYTKDPVEYETQLYIYGSKAERETFLERFHNVAMHDITMNTPGKLTWGEWEIDCVVIFSDTYPHESIPGVTVNDVRFYCPYPRWMKPEAYNIRQGMTTIGEASESDVFPFDFPIDFEPISVPSIYTLSLSHHIPSDFKLIIYGPAAKPQITISGHVYGINYSIPARMYATIDSKEKTVMLSDGKNLFNYRNFESSIFQKINYGKLEIKRSGNFAAKLIVYKESDEPRWTLLSQM